MAYKRNTFTQIYYDRFVSPVLDVYYFMYSAEHGALSLLNVHL